MDSKLKRLAVELKSLCDPDHSGKYKETKGNLKESAKVMHKLGKLYRCKADAEEGREQKISLIRSAVLLNAAALRYPDKQDEVSQDINELCSKVLELAGSHQKDADLKEMDNEIRALFKELRRQVTTRVISLPADSTSNFDRNCYVSIIKMLNESVYQFYISNMKKIMDYCIQVKGPPPCEYALVGMGSLARKEITPFSDFEHIYVLEEGIQLREDYDEILEYFRWVTVIFQFVLINMGETIIPNVAIPYINDNNTENWFNDVFTRRGVCFDGMIAYACKFPLGFSGSSKKPWEIELIKPVSEMAKYLESDEDLKNGYHLADMLASTCFVSGSPSVYEEYQKKVFDVLSRQDSAMLRNIVKEDLESFNANKFVLERLNRMTLNVKRNLYRCVTPFLFAMGRVKRLPSLSSFEILPLLGMFTWHECKELEFAIAFACATRLRTYCFSNTQTNVLSTLAIMPDQKISETVASFVQTAGRLQARVAGHFGLSYTSMYQVYSKNMGTFF